MVTNKKLLSVVIPTYNSSLHLEKCINSVLKQTYTNIELIIVDDNSTDNTKNIIKSFADKDKRIRPFFLKENKGPGHARNLGVSKVKGNYLTLVDHDDFQDLKRYQEMIRTIESTGAEMCVTHSVDYIESTKSYRYNKRFLKPGVYRLNNPKVYKKFQKSYMSPWSKIIKTDLLRKYKLKFAENGVKYDDIMFHSLLATQARSFAVIDGHYYYHRYFDKSITYNFSDHLSMTKDIIGSFEQAIALSYSDNALYEKILNYYIPMLEKCYKRLNSKDFKVIHKEILNSIFMHRPHYKGMPLLVTKRLFKQLFENMKSIF